MQSLDKLLSGLLIAAGSLILLRESAIAKQPLPAKAEVDLATGQIINKTIPGQASGLMQLVGGGIFLYGINGMFESKKREKTSIAFDAGDDLLSAPDIVNPHDTTPVTEVGYQKAEQTPKFSIIEQLATYDKSVLISADTGCGKTTLLKAAIDHLKQTQPITRLLIIDPKKSRWMPPNMTFDDGNSSVQYVSKDTVMDVVDRLTWIADQYIESRQNHRLECEGNGSPYNPPRTIILIDEWVALQGKLERVLSAQEIKNFNRLVQDIIVMGREDKVTIWLVGQSHLCGDIGMKGSIRGNLGVLGLASPDKTDGVEAIANDSYLIKDPQNRQYLSEQIRKLRGKRFYISTLAAEIEIKPTPHIQATQPNQLTTDTDPWEGES